MSQCCPLHYCAKYHLKKCSITTNIHLIFCIIMLEFEGDLNIERIVMGLEVDFVP